MSNPFAEILRKTGHLRQRLRHLGRREPRAVLQDVDVRRYPGDRTLLPRGPHLPQAVAVQVENGGERAATKLRQTGRSVAGRVRQVLLSTYRKR